MTESPLEVESRADLVAFVKLLSDNARDDPESWENQTLPAFLEALAAWVEDMDGYFSNRCEEVPSSPSWKMFALMLAAAKIYE